MPMQWRLFRPAGEDFKPFGRCQGRFLSLKTSGKRTAAMLMGSNHTKAVSAVKSWCHDTSQCGTQALSIFNRFTGGTATSSATTQ